MECVEPKQNLLGIKGQGLLYFLNQKKVIPGGSGGKESACNSGGDLDLIPGSGRSPGEGNGNPLQYSCLQNPMDRGAWGLQSTGSQRVRNNLVTKQQQYIY